MTDAQWRLAAGSIARLLGGSEGQDFGLGTLWSERGQPAKGSAPSYSDAASAWGWGPKRSRKEVRESRQEARSMPTRSAIDEAKKGSAEIVILALVEHESHHSYEIARLIEQRSNGSIRFTLASLYATLYRMEDRGWIRGRWIEKAGQRRR